MLAALMFNLLWVNVMLFGFNMLPVFPMDGGRVLRALLSSPLGRGRATEVASAIGRAIALVAGVYFLFAGYFLQAALAAFVFMVSSAELAAVRREEWHRRQADGWPAPPPGYHWVDRGDGVFRLARLASRGDRLGTGHRR